MRFVKDSDRDDLALTMRQMLSWESELWPWCPSMFFLFFFLYFFFFPNEPPAISKQEIVNIFKFHYRAEHFSYWPHDLGVNLEKTFNMDLSICYCSAAIKNFLLFFMRHFKDQDVGTTNLWRNKAVFLFSVSLLHSAWSVYVSALASNLNFNL